MIVAGVGNAEINALVVGIFVKEKKLEGKIKWVFKETLFFFKEAPALGYIKPYYVRK